MYIKDAIDIPCYVHHQSSLKTRASHTLKFIPLQPSRDTYKYSFWPRTIIDWDKLPSDYLTMDSTSKFYSYRLCLHFFSVMFNPFDLLYFLSVYVWSQINGGSRIYLVARLWTRSSFRIRSLFRLLQVANSCCRK